MTSTSFMRQAETFYRNYVLYCMYSPFTKITYVLSFPPTSLKQFLGAILSAASQAAVISSVQTNSVTQLCLNLCHPMDCSMPGFPVHHQFLELTQTHVHWVGDAIQPTYPLWSPSLPFLFPSNRVFSNESVLHIRWPKYWSLSFSIHPSNEYSGLISFRLDWLDLLAVQESSPTPQFKSIYSLALSFLYSPTLISINDYWKNHSFD